MKIKITLFVVIISFLFSVFVSAETKVPDNLFGYKVGNEESDCDNKDIDVYHRLNEFQVKWGDNYYLLNKERIEAVNPRHRLASDDTGEYPAVEYFDCYVMSVTFYGDPSKITFKQFMNKITPILGKPKVLMSFMGGKVWHAYIYWNDTYRTLGIFYRPKLNQHLPYENQSFRYLMNNYLKYLPSGIEIEENITNDELTLADIQMIYRDFNEDKYPVPFSYHLIDNRLFKMVIDADFDILKNIVEQNEEDKTKTLDNIFNDDSEY